MQTRTSPIVTSGRPCAGSGHADADAMPKSPSLPRRKAISRRWSDAIDLAIAEALYPRNRRGALSAPTRIAPHARSAARAAASALIRPRPSRVTALRPRCLAD